MRYAILAILFFLISCAHDGKPKEACDHTAEEFSEALGESEPTVLDLDGSGQITIRDFWVWLENCSR